MAERDKRIARTSTEKGSHGATPHNTAATASLNMVNGGPATDENEVQASTKVDMSASFWLLSLPAELRNWIYELVIANEPPYKILCFNFAATQPPLTRICRQIRNESLPIHYALSEFRTVKYDIQPTTQTLGPWLSQLHLLQSLTVSEPFGWDLYRLRSPGDGRYEVELTFSDAYWESTLAKHHDFRAFLSNENKNAQRILDARAAAGTFDGRLTLETLQLLLV